MDTTLSPTTTHFTKATDFLYTERERQTDRQTDTHTHTHTHTHSYHFDAPVLQFPIPLRDKPSPTYTGL